MLPGRPGNPDVVCQTLTRSSARGYGRGLIRMLSITAKIAVVPPIPSASVRIAAAVNVGVFRRRRSAWRVSPTSVSVNGSPSLVAIDFLDGFHVAKLQQRLPPRFDGRQATSKVLCRLHGDVFVDFRPQEFFVPRGRCPRHQPAEETPQRLHFRSWAFAAKNRSMIAVVCSQLLASACSCLRPCRVSR